MGLDHITTLFIGRPCTPEEIAHYSTKLKDIPLDKLREVCVFNVDHACDEDTLFTTPDGFAVIAHAYGASYDSMEDVVAREEFCWFVVEQVLKTTSDRWSESDFIPIEYASLEKPKGKGHGLLMVHDLA